uniref:Uncharacterized protein n=1 Tax=Eutreptiella gymnastica TaxID=73025 RepID=A0A7S4GCU6_9EUGL
MASESATVEMMHTTPSLWLRATLLHNDMTTLRRKQIQNLHPSLRAPCKRYILTACNAEKGERFLKQFCKNFAKKKKEAKKAWTAKWGCHVAVVELPRWPREWPHRAGQPPDILCS